MSVNYRHRTRGALRLALSVSVPVAVAAWVVGCGEGENRPPVAVGTIWDLTVTVEVGSTESVDLAGYFSDPDGDRLGYAASSSNAEVATVAVSGDSVAVTGMAIGSAEITVTASDGSFSASQDFTASVHADRRVLKTLYDELGGDGWYDNTNWKTDKPLDEWHGVSTNADGRVDALILWANSLTGAIPPELGSLSNLLRLELHRNSLTGEIPSELGSLPDLRWLYLDNNSLSGEIPPELGDLSNLESLSLSFNRLRGEIPSELGSLSNLELLDLRGNSLTGEIPPELGDLSSLEFLWLDSNSLTGEIPRDFLDLSALFRFYWNDNEGLCAPDTTEFDNWLDGLEGWRGPRCD